MYNLCKRPLRDGFRFLNPALEVVRESCLGSHHLSVGFTNLHLTPWVFHNTSHLSPLWNITQTKPSKTKSCACLPGHTLLGVCSNIRDSYHGIMINLSVMEILYIYPIKYAHAFILLCFVVDISSSLNAFVSLITHIFQGFFILSLVTCLT